MAEMPELVGIDLSHATHVDYNYGEADGDGRGCGEGFMAGPTGQWMYARRKNKHRAMGLKNPMATVWAHLPNR